MLLAALAAGVFAAPPPAIEPVECSRFTQLAEGVEAECGYLRVAEDRNDPSSRIIGVPFAIVRNSRRTEQDPVIFMTGGPGGRVIPGTMRGVDSSFGGRDLVFFEQRGTQLADPRLDCSGYAEEKQRAQRGEIEATELTRNLIDTARRCADAARKSGVRLSGYTTRAIVADVEDFRAAMGYERINLVGLSYSGKVVAEYARDYPEHARAVVANTPLTVEANYDEQGQSAMRRSLDLVLAGCASTPACDDAHQQLERKFREIVARAERDPWQLEIDDPDNPGEKRAVRATPWVVANALLDQLYSPYSFETVPARVDAIWSGDRGALVPIIDIGKSGYPWLMRIALWCNEEAPFEDPERIAEDLEAYPEFAGVNQATVPLGLCDAAGFDVVPEEPENQPVESEVPFLIFSGLFDPATPPAMHRDMVRTLPNATIALFPWGGHAVGFSPCGGSLLEAFLEDPRAALDTSCSGDPAAPDFSRALQ